MKILTPGLEYFDEDHRYLMDGVPITGVSHILRTEFPLPESVSEKEFFKLACDIGTAVHLRTEELDLGLPFTYTPYEIDHFVDAWKTWKAENHAKILHVEIGLGSYKQWFCGTLDRIVEIEGKLYVVDIKSGGLSTRGRVQLGAYVILARENNIDIEGGILVSLKNGEVVDSYIKQKHIDRFQSILDRFNLSEEAVW